MGTKTRISTAIFGAVLMFFLGSNIPLLTSMLGLTRRGNFGAQAKGSSLSLTSAAAVEAAAAALTSAAGSSGGAGGGSSATSATGQGGKPRLPTKNAVAAEVLRGVLLDDDRRLCSVRYPAGLSMTQEQKDYIDDQRYFIVITLRNNEELLHHALYELLNVIARLGPRHVFVSVFENNSKDKTPQFLALFTDLLKLAGVAHNLVSTFTLARELEALKRSGKLDVSAAAPGSLAAGAAAGSSRRLLEERAGGEGQGAELQAQWMQEAIEAELMARFSEEGEEEEGWGNSSASSSSSGSSSSSREWWPEEEEEGLNASSTGAAAADFEDAYRQLFKALREGSSAPAAPAAPAAAPAPGPRGRALGEEEERDMIALLTEGKWTGNRIEFLARVRNRSIRPLFSRKEKYDKLIVMNDAIFCAEDVLRLALHEEADVACGLDFDTTAAYGTAFYDTWVTKDISGQPFSKPVPFVSRADDVRRLRLGRPVPVFCCWNGLLVASAEPFYAGVRFRRGLPGECAASECSLFCKDFWRKRARNFAVDPHVRVAYDLETYTALHKVGWLEAGHPEAVGPGAVQWPEDIPWARRPPEKVHCWGLDGNGRDPDTAPFMEEQNLELL